jgi:thiopeptide-type bacteriocin biosynthesis protein
MNSETVQDWFFIRYEDPDPHLRLRFKGDPQRLVTELLPRLCRWGGELVTQGICSRLCFDTYDRELERYGGSDGMVVAEELFGADSRAVVQMLSLLAGGLQGLDKTCLAVLSIDDLLGSLGASEDDRVAWSQEVESNQFASDDYRERKIALRKLLGNPEHLWQYPGGGALLSVLAARRKTLSNVALRLDSLTRDGVLSVTKNTLYRSYVHMHCNRLIGRDDTAEHRALSLLRRTRLSLKRSPLHVPRGT